MNCWNWWPSDKEVFLTTSAFPFDHSTLEEHILHRTVFLLQKKNQIIKYIIKVSVKTYIKFHLTVIPKSFSEQVGKQDPVLIVQYTQVMVFMMRKPGYKGRANQSQHERQYHNIKNAYPWFSSSTVVRDYFKEDNEIALWKAFCIPLG